MKLRLKNLLSLLCALLLVVGLIPATAFTATAELGGDFPWTDEEKPMLIEQILERDGFIDGIWFPWLNGSGSGHNLTGNELMAAYYNSSASSDWNRVELDYIGADKIYQQIYNLKAMGYNIMAYGGSIYGEGVEFSETGNVVGIKQDYLDNARRLLDMCREIGMPVMWNVYFHCSSMPNYHGIDGWKVICQMLGNQEIARNYAENFVAPLCEMLAEYPDVVALVSIADEPENEINDVGKGNNFSGSRTMYGVTQEDMVYFMKQINDTVREKLPNVARTVASNAMNKAIYRDFDLDLMGHNRYADALNQFPAVEDFVTDADPILTEYNVGNASYDDEQFTQIHIGFREEMREKGYKGGFAWCWLPNKSYTNDSDYYLLRNAYDNLSFRKSVTDLRHYMDNCRKKYRGEAAGLSAPVLYANYGDGKVRFIPANDAAATITVQRSDDGGKTWKTLIKDVPQADYVDDYSMGLYTDTDDAKPKSGYCYRIIAKRSGVTVTSEPNYPAGADLAYKKTFVKPTYKAGIYYQPTTQTKAEAEADKTKLISFGDLLIRPQSDAVNLIKNGSFENASGGQWNNRSFLNQYISVVEDSTAPEGKKSLKFDTSATQEPGWYKFTVSGLEKDSNYVLSTWIKGDYLKSTNKGMASLGVIDPDTGTFMTYYEYYRGYARSSRETQQIYPTAWDKDWHLRSVVFTTGDNTSFTFALYGYGSVMWLDGLAVYKNGNGTTYTNGQSEGLDTGYIFTSGRITCDPRDSLVEDVTVDDKAYWTAGSGWRNGFMSFHESRVQYGYALKYTASSDPNGVYYLKSVPVKPNTDYYVSFDVKILESGSGRVVLMNNGKTELREALGMELDADIYGDGWYHYRAKFNSGVYQQVNFGVCDLGGSALIDNIRIFKESDEESVKELYTYSVKTTNKVAYGKTASVEARATGDGLKYQWYFKDKGASKFSLTTSFKTKTYSVQMNKSRDGRQVYCVITDKYGTSRRTATTTLTVKRATLKITTQPKTGYAQLNKTAKATVKATGDGLKYTWYIKNAGATKYSKSSITSATYSVKMTEKVHGRRVYCVVTDVWGNKVQSNTVLLRRAASIVTQPKSVTVAKNKTAKVTVKAAGDGLKYTWYIKNAGSSKYSKSSVTKSTYSCKMTSKVNGRYVYCVVTDKYGKTVKTTTVRVKMK